MYYVYEYPNGAGCISLRKLKEHTLCSEHNSIAEAKEALKDIITRNKIRRIKNDNN